MFTILVRQKKNLVIYIIEFLKWHSQLYLVLSRRKTVGYCTEMDLRKRGGGTAWE